MHKSTQDTTPSLYLYPTKKTTMQPQKKYLDHKTHTSQNKPKKYLDHKTHTSQRQTKEIPRPQNPHIPKTNQRNTSTTNLIHSQRQTKEIPRPQNSYIPKTNQRNTSTTKPTHPKDKPKKYLDHKTHTYNATAENKRHHNATFQPLRGWIPRRGGEQSMNTNACVNALGRQDNATACVTGGKIPPRTPQTQIPIQTHHRWGATAPHTPQERYA